MAFTVKVAVGFEVSKVKLPEVAGVETLTGLMPSWSLIKIRTFWVVVYLASRSALAFQSKVYCEKVFGVEVLTSQRYFQAVEAPVGEQASPAVIGVTVKLEAVAKLPEL